MEKDKHYLSTCNSAPSDRLALIALKNLETVLRRNCQIIDQNLIEINALFARDPE
jgi:hypothetical protein